MKGKVKFFNGYKGFGFIKAEDGEEYFVHISDVKQNLVLDDDMKVEFEVTEGEKGMKAIDVEILSKDAEVDLDGEAEEESAAEEETQETEAAEEAVEEASEEA
jgi:CspA family cold shock protein